MTHESHNQDEHAAPLCSEVHNRLFNVPHVLRWPSIRQRCLEHGFDLQLVPNRRAVLSWRGSRQQNLPILAAHPAMFVSSDGSWLDALTAVQAGSSRADGPADSPADSPADQAPGGLVQTAPAGGSLRAARQAMAVARQSLALLNADDPRWFAAMLGPPALDRLQDLQGQLGSKISVSLHDNRRLMIALRQRSVANYAFSFHFQLLVDSRGEDLMRWCQQRGRGQFARLNASIQRVFDELREISAAQRRPESGLNDVGAIQPAREAQDVVSIPPGPYTDPAVVGSGCHVADLIDDVYRRHFDDLPRIPCYWSRRTAENKPLRNIRFGSFRSHPKPHIRLHPRLLRPWVPKIFVELVIHHELCHYRQHCQPMRGETMHSARFKAWEREYPHFEQAIAWERQFLPTLLAAWNPAQSVKRRHEPASNQSTPTEQKSGDPAVTVGKSTSESDPTSANVVNPAVNQDRSQTTMSW